MSDNEKTVVCAVSGESISLKNAVGAKIFTHYFDIKKEGGRVTYGYQKKYVLEVLIRDAVENSNGKMEDYFGDLLEKVIAVFDEAKWTNKSGHTHLSPVFFRKDIAMSLETALVAKTGKRVWSLLVTVRDWGGGGFVKKVIGNVFEPAVWTMERIERSNFKRRENRATALLRDTWSKRKRDRVESDELATTE